MRGCGDIPASRKIPRLCKAGLGEVDSSSFTSLRTQELQPTLNRKIGVIITFRITGFRPGGRATFVSAKVAKTNDALPGRIG